MQPETAIGKVERGMVIPGVGTVSKVRSLVGIMDRLLGKHHNNSAVFLVNTIENRTFKLITFLEQPSARQSSRTRVAAGRLDRFSCDNCVPKTFYVDDRSMVVGFVPGSVLTEGGFTEESARDLGRFISANQSSDVQATEVVVPDYERMFEKLRRSPEVDRELLDALHVQFRRTSSFGESPRALCFFDSAMKNFVRTATGNLVYVDVFGIAPRLVGAACVRQTLAIPVPWRESFLQAYLETSENATAIMERLPDYCLQHLLYRAAHQLDVPGTEHKRTLKRRRKRRLAYRAAMDSLRSCVDLPRTSDAFHSWLLTANV